MRFVYLHGFASSPGSTKAVYLRDRFAELNISLVIPELNQDDFAHLTITRQISQIKTEFLSDETSVTLIGSSLGGLTAAWLGQKYLQVQRLVLLAPAFGFLSHWLTQLGEEQMREWQASGYLSVYHYAEKRSIPLHYHFIEDAGKYETEGLSRHVPTLILHGKKDEVIPIHVSRDYAKVRSWVELVEMDSDHALNDVMPDIWQLIQDFCPEVIGSRK